MDTAITAILRHGAKNWELLYGPDTPAQKQIEFAESATDTETNSEFAEMMMIAPEDQIVIRGTFRKEGE